jgi:hypothetical protein
MPTVSGFISSSSAEGSSAQSLNHRPAPLRPWRYPDRHRALRTKSTGCGHPVPFATSGDVALLLLIRELAAYEQPPDAVLATEDDLRRHGFGAERRFEGAARFR